MWLIMFFAILAFAIGYKYGKDDGVFVSFLCGIQCACLGAAIGLVFTLTIFSNTVYENSYLERDKISITSLSLKIGTAKRFSNESQSYEPEPYYFYFYITGDGSLRSGQVSSYLVKIIEEDRNDMYIAKLDIVYKSDHSPYIHTSPTGGYIIHVPIGTTKKLLE